MLHCGYDDESDDGSHPSKSMAEVLAAELGPSVEEAGHLEDATITPSESNDEGIIYSHILDAESVHLPEAPKQKLLKKFGELSNITLSNNLDEDPHWSRDL